jgi:hypothetical protein
MAAATLANNSSGQGIVKVFSFTSVADASTFAYSGPVKSWTCTNKAASNYVTAAYSAGVFTFKVASGTPDADLWILL